MKSLLKQGHPEHSGCPCFLLALLLFLPPAVAQDKGERAINEWGKEIRTAAQEFCISPRLLACIVYAERQLNVKPGEDILDVVLAEVGYNSSIGPAQIKVSTAAWIERELADSGALFFLGEKHAHVIPVCATDEERIEKLHSAATNLEYAAAYVAMIEKLWQPTLESRTFDSTRAGIIATIYSLGIIRPDGTVRKPHPDAMINFFGKTAEECFDSRGDIRLQ